MALKYGVDLNELTSTGGTEIEIDTEAESLAASGAGAVPEDDTRNTGRLDEHYNRDDIIKEVCLEPIVGRRESPESESDEGLV